MTQNLKIEVLTGDISIDGMVVTNLVTKEELSTAIVKKADLGTDGKIPTSQLPAEIVNTAGIVDEVKLQLETSIKDAVDESNAYAESYTDNALSSKADLTSGKVPLEQLPAIDQYPQFGTALSNLSTSILTSVKQRTDQLEKSKADLGEDGKVLREQIPSYEKISGLPEQLEVMTTQTAAVSDELDQHKLQTADQIDTLKENIEANVQQLTDRQSHLMRTYATKELGVDAKVGVKPGEYFHVRSTNEEEMLVEYQNAGGVPTPSGKSYPSSVAVQKIADYTALPFKQGKSYALYERVRLANGEIVKSNVSNNTVNPNVDMTSWILTSTYIVDSIADMLAIENPKDGSLCKVKSFYSPDNLALAQPFKGGDDFVFNSTKSLINDNISVFNGWQRISNNLDAHKAGLKGDGVTDDLAAIRNYVLFLANSGGGTVIFSESDLGYKFSDAIYVVSDVSFDINSQKLIGTSGKSLFKTAKITSGTYVPITSFDPLNVIINSQISNATIHSASIAFDLRSFTLLCSVKNIQFQYCTQGFVLRDCFYSRWENLQATPTSGSPALPFYHLASSNNAMIFDRVSATVEWGWLIEGGSTALQFNVCTFEGGSKGYVIKGDVLGCAFNTGYYEAVTGTLFDLSQAGNCILSFESNYINGVDIIFQDGGTGTLFGNWESSNSIVNIGEDLGTAFTFRGLMNVSSARNYIKFNLSVETSDDISTPANWNLSKASDFNRVARWNADGVTDIRAVADVHGGVIPVKYSGDFGNPYLDRIHYCTKSALATGSSVSLNIDTQLTYQPLSLFTKVLLEFRREVAGVYQYYHVYGDIYGSIFELKGGLDVAAGKQITANVVNNAGNLRIVLNNIANPNGDLIVTGTVRAIS